MAATNTPGSFWWQTGCRCPFGGPRHYHPDCPFYCDLCNYDRHRCHFGCELTHETDNQNHYKACHADELQELKL